MGNGDRISEIQTPFSMISHPPAALSITAMAEPIGRVLLLLEIPPDDATEVSKIEAVGENTSRALILFSMLICIDFFM